MPIYEYRCGDCGPFDMIRSMAESQTPTVCPHCGHIARRVVSRPTIWCGGDCLGFDAGLGHEPTRAERRANEKKGIRPLSKSDIDWCWEHPDGRDHAKDDAYTERQINECARSVIKERLEKEKIVL